MQSNNYFSEDYLFLKRKDKWERVAVELILFFEIEANHIKVVAKDSQYVLTMTFSKLEEMLQGNTFLRIHRKFIVNLSEMTGLDLENRYALVGDYKIPIGRTKKAELLSRIKRLY